ncbi:hypothetical protein PYCC9005_000301 [Savitreella phatthalungensis]
MRTILRLCTGILLSVIVLYILWERHEARVRFLEAWRSSRTSAMQETTDRGEGSLSASPPSKTAIAVVGNVNPEYGLASADGSKITPGHVVLVDMNNGEHNPAGAYIDFSDEIHQRDSFCKASGMSYFHSEVELTDRLEIMYSKPKLIRQAFQRYPEAEWALYMDFDAMFVRNSTHWPSFMLSQPAWERMRISSSQSKGGVEDFWPSPDQFPDKDMAESYAETEFIVTGDMWGLNMGSFMVRRRPVADTVLDFWTEPRMHGNEAGVIDEQSLFAELLSRHDSLRKRTTIVKQTSINTYEHQWRRTPGGKGTKDMLIMHMAGCWMREGQCAWIWQQFAEVRAGARQYFDSFETRPEGATRPRSDEELAHLYI